MKKLLAALAIVGLSSAAAMAAPATIDLYRALTSTNTAVTVTTGGTYQAALAQNLNRKDCTILNNNVSDVIYIYFGTATAANGVGSNLRSIPITTGTSFNCAVAGVGVITDQIVITGDTSSDTAVVIEQN